MSFAPRNLAEELLDLTELARLTLNGKHSAQVKAAKEEKKVARPVAGLPRARNSILKVDDMLDTTPKAPNYSNIS